MNVTVIRFETPLPADAPHITAPTTSTKKKTVRERDAPSIENEGYRSASSSSSSYSIVSRSYASVSSSIGMSLRFPSSGLLMCRAIRSVFHHSANGVISRLQTVISPGGEPNHLDS
jgi:hypothetical protein